MNPDIYFSEKFNQLLIFSKSIPNIALVVDLATYQINLVTNDILRKLTLNGDFRKI